DLLGHRVAAGGARADRDVLRLDHLAGQVLQLLLVHRRLAALADPVDERRLVLVLPLLRGGAPGHAALRLELLEPLALQLVLLLHPGLELGQPRDVPLDAAELVVELLRLRLVAHLERREPGVVGLPELGVRATEVLDRLLDFLERRGTGAHRDPPVRVARLARSTPASRPSRLARRVSSKAVMSSGAAASRCSLIGAPASRWDYCLRTETALWRSVRENPAS